MRRDAARGDGETLNSDPSASTRAIAGSDVWTGNFWIGDVNIDNDSLWLAYSDDGYGDNGYWGHDDGTSDQCKGVGSALRILITSIHQ